MSYRLCARPRLRQRPRQRLRHRRGLEAADGSSSAPRSQARCGLSGRGVRGDHGGARVGDEDKVAEDEASVVHHAIRDPILVHSEKNVAATPCCPPGACSSTAAARLTRPRARRAPRARERVRGAGECVVPGRAAPRAARSTRRAPRPVVRPARDVARRARARRRRQRGSPARGRGGLLEPEVKGPTRDLDGTCLERRRFAAIL